jgi:hypothetical protein
MERVRAEAAAEEVGRLTGEGVKAVRIVDARDDRGRPLYLVQFGRFATRQEAAAVREALGRRSYIVAPVGEGASLGR